MNTDISPLKQLSYLSPKHNIASFKKFNPRSPKNDQQSKQISPFKYMNTEVNPQIGKNMTQSAHHLGYNYVKHQTSTKPGTAKKQEFMKSINFLDKNSTLTPNSQLNKNFLSPNRLEIDIGNSIRNRKLSYNDLGTDKMAVKIAQRKSELKPNTEQENDDEMPQMRDRKLSYQVSANHLHSQQQPSFKKQHQWSNTTNSNPSFLSPQSHRRLSDLSPGVFPSRNKIDFGQTIKMHPQVATSHSHPHIPHNDHPKTSFPTFNQSKFRKNSYTDQQQKDPKTQVPSFLLKKIKKQNQQPSSKPIQLFPPTNKPRASSYTPQTQEPTKQRTFSLKDFQLLKQLGEGKFGKVLLVKQKLTGFVCAMKVFKKSQIKADNFIDQFIRQMKIQLFLNHPNIIKMYGYFDDLSFIYILLEVASQGTLYGFLQNLHRQERLKNSGHSQQKHQQGKSGLTGLNLKQTAVIMYQLCSGIKYLHANEIIHRDLKPQNIVIHEKTIKLCDFGWSVFKGSQMRTTFCGTPLYLCPQLITGEQYDEKADIWAIGVMLYEFLVGPNPFNIRQEADLTNIISQKVNLEQQGKLDDTVIDLINGCLDKDPHQRYDIKQIVNHEFFKKYCPELMLGASGNLARQNSMGVSEMMK